MKRPTKKNVATLHRYVQHAIGREPDETSILGGKRWMLATQDFGRVSVSVHGDCHNAVYTRFEDMGLKDKWLPVFPDANPHSGKNNLHTVIGGAKTRDDIDREVLETVASFRHLLRKLGITPTSLLPLTP